MRGYLRFERTPNAIPELDGLRAIAVLLVLARHAFKPVHEEHPEMFQIAGFDWSALFVNGWIGVDLFFVLSGFLITRHLVKRDIRTHGLGAKRYFTGRALRIIPTYVFVMAIVVAGVIPLFEISRDDLAWRVGYHLLFLQDYLRSDIVVAFWSLGVEEKFYILAPILALATVRFQGRRKYVFLGVLLMVPTLARSITLLSEPGISSYVVFFSRFRSPFHVTADGLIAGVICAHLYLDRDTLPFMRDRRVHRAMFWGGTALVLAHLIPLVLLESIGPYDKSIQQLVISIGFAAVMLAVICDDQKHPILSSGIGLFYARISYALYLIHLPLLGMAYTRYLDALQHESLGLFTYVIFFAGISTIAAVLIHFVVEKPFLLLKDRHKR